MDSIDLKQLEEVVERAVKRADRVLLVAVNIDKDALERARQLGIDVIYGSVIE